MVELLEWQQWLRFDTLQSVYKFALQSLIWSWSVVDVCSPNIDFFLQIKLKHRALAHFPNSWTKTLDAIKLI